MTLRRVPYPKFGVGPGLERVARVASTLAVDLPAFGEAGIVVVGSNGKGSTAAMTAALLQQTGGPVGLFTSPHLFDINERFRIDGEDISDGELDRHWRGVANAIEAAGLSNEFGGFEFLFLIAADWFAARGCRHTVWEAGIGGRLDPVRLIEAQRLALTALDFEHTELLGDSLADIARDKADAAPEGATLYVGERCAEVFPLIQEHSSVRGVRAELVPGATAYGLEPPLAGEHQRGNTALALALARDVAALENAMIRRGLTATRWPGRLEVLSREPLVVIDVGHTPDAIAAALAGFRQLARGRPAVLVCGASRDKAVESIIGGLAPAFAKVICAAARHKGAAVADIAVSVSAANPQAELVLADSMEEARRLALASAGAGGAVYVAGSLFLAAEFRALHLGRDPATLHFF